MPTIPAFVNTERVQVGGGPPRIDPGALAQPAVAIERGGAEFAHTMVQFDARYQEARRQADASSLISAATEKLGDAQFRWSKTPDRQMATNGFNEEAQKLRDEAIKGINDPGVAAYFTQHFDQQRIMRGLDTQNAAFGLEAATRRGALDTRLQTYAQQAATATNPLLRAQITDLVDADIKGSVAAGWLNPEAAAQQGIRFKSRIDEVAARSLMTADPDQALAALTDPRTLPNLDEKTRATLIDTATRRSIAAVEHADRQAERALKKLEEDSGKTGYQMMQDGTLSRGWIDANRGRLSKNDYAGFLNALDAGAEKQKDNPATVAEIEPRLDTGDLSTDITRAFKNAELSVPTYRSMMERNRNHLKDDQPNSPMRSGRDLVKTTLDPGQLLSGAAASIGRAGLAQALVEYDNWTGDNPKAPRAEAIGQAQDIIKRYQAVQFDQMSLATGMPRFAMTTRSKVDAAALDAAEDETARQFAAKKISKETAEQEARKIETWRQILATRPATTGAK